MDYREIVEKDLGRKLLSTEIVHHKDGNQHNNKLSNLEITNRNEHLKKKHLTSKDWEKVIQDLLVDNINITAQNFNNALDILFTFRQKEIIFRKIYGFRLSKTEKEYYSRIIKKKIRAVASTTLYRIARILATQ